MSVGLWEAVGHSSGGGEAQSEVLGIAGVGLGVPRPARRSGTSGSQTLGHPGATGSHGRAEYEEGAGQLDLALGPRGKREESSGWIPWGESPWLVRGWLSLGLG